MAKIVSELQVNSFVKGLITEASPLTFPKNASMDEENFDLEIDGSRSRRLGIDYETEYTLTDTLLPTNSLKSTRVSFIKWPFPGGSSTLVLGVVLIGDRLYFMDLLQANPSTHLKNGGAYLTVPGIWKEEVQSAIINGYLVLVSKELPYPIVLSYNKETDVVSQEFIKIIVRDLDGVEDGMAVDHRPSILISAHKYNLMNQGWSSNIPSICSVPSAPSETVGPITYVSGIVIEKAKLTSSPTTSIGAIECTKQHLTVYPSNSDVWTLGKIADTAVSADFQKYSPLVLQKNSLQTSQAPRGKYLLDIFNRGTSRASATNIPVGTHKFTWHGTTVVFPNGLLLDQERGKLTTIASYSGRLFYSGINSDILPTIAITASPGYSVQKDDRSPNYSGYIFFSQIASTLDKFGKCYQENDPTDPDISDVLDTDGGTIQIPEISLVTKLVATRSSLVVFAENGIWEVFGDTDGFKATSYQTSKVSNIGVSNPSSIVDADGTIFYWAKTGIHMLVQDPQTGRLQTKNISLDTIQSFYNDIPNVAKINVRGFYDEEHNHVRWIYNDSDTYSEENYINNYTKELNLDLALQSFYVYTISSLDTNSPYICDYVSIPGYSLNTITTDVYAEGNQVIVTSGDGVIVDTTTSTSRSGTYKFLIMRGSSFTLGLYNNSSFFDWVTADGIGKDFSSFLITGYELSGDILRKKQSPYILFYFDRTEDGFTQVGDDLLIDNPSGCLVQAQWNWANSAASGKWGTQFQAYRLLRNYIPSGPSDTFDYGDRVIVTKNKVRGSGRALSLKIQSESGKDMKLLGWANEITGVSKP